MADSLSISSGVVALGTFALQSGVTLYTAIRSLQQQNSNTRALKGELSDLNEVLETLLETVASDPEIRFDGLESPLLRCGKACKDYAKIIAKCTQHSAEGRIVSVTPRVIEDYKDMIKDTAPELQDHLQSLDEKLEALASKRAENLPQGSIKWETLLEEEKSAQQGLQICAQLSSQIEQWEATSKEHPNFSQQPSTPKHIKSSLLAARSSIQTLTTRLQSHLEDIDQQLEALRSTELGTDEVHTLLTPPEPMLEYEDHGDQLLELSAGLPLALTQAAASMQQTQTNFGQYINPYNTRDLMQSQGNKGVPLPGCHSSIWTTWMISFERIQAKNEAAAELLLLWVPFDNQDLWYGLFERFRERPCASSSSPITMVPLEQAYSDEIWFNRRDGASQLLPTPPVPPVSMSSSSTSKSKSSSSSTSALKRLSNELARLEDGLPQSCLHLGPPDDSNLFYWEAVLRGPRDPASPYHVGLWLLSIAIPTRYPNAPPKILFKTPICHPNVHFQTGEICLTLLNGEHWQPSYRIAAVMDAIQQLLSDPGLDSPLNVDIANLWRERDDVGAEGLIRYWTAEKRWHGEGTAGWISEKSKGTGGKLGE
ncbi:hypothetical protein DV736_g3720, partial [Chaetothyriales sp. CBS 134916]